MSHTMPDFVVESLDPATLLKKRLDQKCKDVFLEIMTVLEEFYRGYPFDLEYADFKTYADPAVQKVVDEWLDFKNWKVVHETDRFHISSKK